MKSRIWLACFASLLALAGPGLASSSVFATAPADSSAVTVAGRGDGKADDTKAIQQAIDQAAAHNGGGLVFLPSGRYRISRSILLWPQVRIYGVGPTRPVLVLGDKTPGFQRGVANMVVFTGAKRGQFGRVAFPPPSVVPFDRAVADANQNTFYSAISNVDMEIGAGNPAAIAVRFHVAQHAFLSHMEFHLGSGFAGVYQVGNVMRDVHFYGGRYGIVTEKTSPAWQFTIIDSSFEGQRSAAIREHEVGLTLVNVAIRNTPVGIDIDRGYSDHLWGKDVRFENVKQAGIIISNENIVHTQIGFDNALAANTPVFARFRDSGRAVAGRGRFYRVKDFSYGLKIPALGQMGQFATDADIAQLDSMPAQRAPAVRDLPPVSEWASVRNLGAKGDGKTDDTAALQHAIDTHRVVYLPIGNYRVTDTLHLKPDTVLVALHPNTTNIVLPDETSGYAGVGAPKAVIQSAEGGNAIVSGIGLFTGWINPRATGLLWMAGVDSLVDDVKFQLGISNEFGASVPQATFNAAQTAQNSPAPSPFFSTKPMPRWDGQYPSLWVTKNGGGTFVDCWTPDTFAGAGFYISDTTTPGHAYEMSVEHHVRHEIVMERVANWELLAPQTEEEYRESGNAVSLEIRDSHDILIANYHAYRVTRTQLLAPTAVRLHNVRNIRFRNLHTNAENGYTQCDGDACITYLRANKFPFSNAIEDVTSGQYVREREFASLDIPGTPAPAATPAASAGVKKLADGFFALGGGAVDSKGKLYFADRTFQRIYSWTQGHGLEVASDHPLDADNLAVDRSDNLLVLSSAGFDGSAFSLDPNSPGAVAKPVAPVPADSRGRALIAIPTNWWVNGELKDQYDPARDHFTTLAEMFARDAATPPRRNFVSPDGSLVLPDYPTVHQGPPDNRGWRFSHGLDTYGFTLAEPGTRIYVSNSSEARTYSAKVGPNGALSDLKVFADRGGESVTKDDAGRVYIANGEIFMHAADGREIGRIDVPERPIQLVIGGADRKTLFVLTQHALYAVDLAQVGR